MAFYISNGRLHYSSVLTSNMVGMSEFVGGQLNSAKSAVAAVASTVAAAAKPGLAAGVGFVKEQGVGKSALAVGGAAVAAYFLWPTAFLANPKLYFHLLRTVGAKAAAAAFLWSFSILRVGRWRTHSRHRPQRTLLYAPFLPAALGLCRSAP
uniref:Uncharacterized protein n=1 Tax=Oryza barthii TaxID=65489 RepID=A0A0D3GTA7_9ORYZ